MMTLLSISIIIISLTAMFNGGMWNYWHNKSKKLQEQLASSQGKLLKVQNNIMVEDIKLKDTRYIIENKEIIEVVVESVSFIDNHTYIQVNQVDLDYFDFEYKVTINREYHSHYLLVAKYKTFIQQYQIKDYMDSYHIRSTIIQALKRDVFRNKIPKYIKLSDTYYSKEEAQLVLQERKDKEFERKVKQLEENYNKDLDNLLNKI